MPGVGLNGLKTHSWSFCLGLHPKATVMAANQALQATPRHSLRMPGYARSLRSLGAPERDR
jgi:PhnB protein